MNFQKKKNLTGIIVILLIVSTFFTGCATFDRFSERFIDEGNTDGKTVKIGIFNPLPGEYEEDAKYEIQGIELAHDLYPEILGKKVELVYGDNKSDVDVARTAAEDLVDKGVSVILGSWGNTLSLAGSEVFEKTKVPAITISASNPLITSSEYYFRACYIESFQGVAMAKYAVEQTGAGTAAILKDEDDDYAAAISKAFSDKFISLTEDER